MTSVLFVGHSLVNTTMPGMVDQLLDSGAAPHSTVYHQVINGAPLSWNWEHSAEAQGTDGRALLASTADFERGVDRIDTSAFLRAADMLWRGESSFTGRAGEVRFLAESGVVQIDTDGDGRVDARFVVEETMALSAADFL